MNSATLNAYVDLVDSYNVNCGIIYDTAPNLSLPSSIIMTTQANGDYSINIVGLESGVTYYYRAFANDAGVCRYGKTRNFTTSLTPTFGDNTVSNIGLTTFDISTKLLDEDSNALRLRAFIYKQVADENDKDLTMSTKDVKIIPVDHFDGITTINELFTGTLYAIRPCAISGSGIGLGDITYVKTDKTDQTMLSLCTLSDSTTSSIAVEALVLSLGTHPIIETGFCYSSENKNPTVENLTVESQLDGTTIKKTTLTNLNSNTTYYIRAYAKSEDNSYAYSEKAVEYKVLEHKVLEVSILAADEVSTISARLLGNVRDNNVAISERGFCYSTSETAPTVDNATRLVVNTTHYLYSTVIDVTYNTTYYYRAYAVNEEGTVFYGEVRSFKTADVVVTTGAATDITDNGATIGGTVNYTDELLTCGIIYGISSTLSSSSGTIKSTTSSGDFSVSILDLSSNTIYYYRAYAVVDGEYKYGEVRSFTTLQNLEVNTDNADEISASNARLWGHVTDNNVPVSERGFCWSTSEFQPEDKKMKDNITYVVVNTDEDKYSYMLDGTVPNTTYYFCAFAKNSMGEVYYGDVLSFTTLQNLVVTTIDADVISASSVHLWGHVTDNNVPVSERGFCWSTSEFQPEDKNVLDNITYIVVDANEEKYSYTLDVESVTTYYFCAYAKNSDREVYYGDVLSFITPEVLEPEAVDLGLSVKWASFNVGAQTPEEYGDYFAWGETSPKSSYTESNSVTYGLSTLELKSRGIIDADGKLTVEYDAAAVNWDGDWRMPTLYEIDELVDNCTWTWTIVEGGYGYLVIGPNGNSIFLPATGYRNGGDMNGRGSRGDYWSATLDEYLSEYANSLYFSSSNYFWNNYNRSGGRTVRPVADY